MSCSHIDWKENKASKIFDVDTKCINMEKRFLLACDKMIQQELEKNPIASLTHFLDSFLFVGLVYFLHFFLNFFCIRKWVISRNNKCTKNNDNYKNNENSNTLEKQRSAFNLHGSLLYSFQYYVQRNRRNK